MAERKILISNKDESAARAIFLSNRLGQLILSIRNRLI
jgi:hypothetical protein